MFANTDNVVLCVDSRLNIYSLKSSEPPIIVEFPKLVSKNEKKSANDTKSARISLICGEFSKSGHLFAVCDDKKRLLVWNFLQSEGKCDFIREFNVARKCVKLVFHSDEKQILVGDRSGDIFRYDLRSEGSEGSLLMGHLSMLLDFSLSCDEKYLITCDRDEKIRVSCFPNSYNIHGYCLGHSEFVSSLCYLKEEIIISGSGDGTLRIWNYVNGEQLCVHDCSKVKDTGKRIAVKQILKISDDLVAVTFYDFGDLLIYKVARNDDLFSISLIKCVTISTSKLHKIFISNNCLIATSLNKEEMFLCFEIEWNSCELRKSNDKCFIKCINEDKKFIEECYEEFDAEAKSLDGLYKTWFNNVDTYLEKKRERQVAKKLKQCKNGA
ncbi:hypothetical protein B4U80_08156 [Leptotrombidium deliense]|uniref:tRNA (guanine-N(7)-)-methyltransferase non-catalytic subunit n=1 Tax=Leptotrombidium deliense TaxID=299467 RepID=A0A443SPD3_9ACAR|nr:hypothetical protein B4U80_08156 [Leptotrombidium deliense]